MRAAVIIALVFAAASAGSAAPAPAAGPLEDLTNEIIHGGSLDGTPPSAYAWSPDGARLAYMRRPEAAKKPGLRILEIAQNTTTSLSQESITSFDWSPSGDAIAAVSSGDLYLIPVGVQPATAPRRLTTTDAAETDARFSPDGMMIGFVRDHNIWALDLATLRERRITGGNTSAISLASNTRSATRVERHR